MRSPSAWLPCVAVSLVLCSSMALEGCSSKKPSGGESVSSGGGDGGTSRDASTKDAGKTKPKPKPDAGSSTLHDGSVRADGSALDVDAAVIVYRDAGTQTVFGNDAGAVPAGWTCPASFWSDGICDCSCGAFDYDCHGNSCDTPGCVVAACDACFTDTYAWKACLPDPDPSAWNCTQAAQNDNNCDCGCGYPDPACHGSGCTEAGCWRSACDVRHDNTGAALPSSTPPFTWECAKAKWGGGDGCDCGCDKIDPNDHDPDCVVQGAIGCGGDQCVVNGCEICHDKERFETLPHCNILLDPNTANGWTCAAWRYNTGDGCDCGCGVPDPDCAGAGCSTFGCTTTSGCERCTTAAFGTTELVGCVPQGGAKTWSCDPHHYGTHDGCDCGCGIPDPDCNAATSCTDPGCTDPGSCDYCHIGGTDALADYTPCKPTPSTGWSCGDISAPAWANTDGKCDCGCGKPDPLCRVNQRKDCTTAGCQTAVCQACNDGHGGRADCTGPRWNELGLCEPKVYAAGDGKCDCGCGAIDPDCPKDQGCAEPGCGVNGCTNCYASGGVLQVCQYWTCPAGTESNGKCDCGCGGADPECNNQGCIEPGCTRASCQAWHDPFGRSVAAP